MRFDTDWYKAGLLQKLQSLFLIKTHQISTYLKKKKNYPQIIFKLIYDIV